MEINRQDLNRYLYVFNLIVKKGTKVDHYFELDGLKAWHDFDGYTCWLAYKDLTITLLFHGKYQLDFKHKETIDVFAKKVLRLAEL